MMAKMQIGDSGFAFLVETNGYLVATSTLTSVLDSNDERVNTLEYCNHTGIFKAVQAVASVHYLCY